MVDVGGGDGAPVPRRVPTERRPRIGNDDRPLTSIAMWDPQPSSQQRACDSGCQQGVASNEHRPSLDALEE